MKIARTLISLVLIISILTASIFVVDFQVTQASGVIGIPSNIVTNVTERSIHISWNGVESADRYEIEADGVVIDCRNNKEYHHTGLEPETNHIYRIRAVNQTNIGEWSQSITVQTTSQYTVQSTTPSVITIPTNIVTSESETSIHILWDDVLYADSYEIEVDGIIIDCGNSKEYNHTGLEPGTTHTYRVRAKNQTDIGKWSQLLNVKTTVVVQLATPSIITIPTNIVKTETETSIHISWDQVDNAELYEIEVDGIIYSTPNTYYSHTELNENEEHTYRVRALNSNQTSEWSQYIIVKTLTYQNGDGTEEMPFIIRTKDDLRKINENPSANYMLVKNIDLQRESWTPLRNFTGTLNGNGYSIKNLYINGINKDYQGLFSQVIGGRIENVSLENVTITGKLYVGSLVGELNNGTIENCSIIGDVTINGINTAGGLVGITKNYSVIDKCEVRANVGNGSIIGGIVGNHSGTITQSYYIGSLSGSRFIGGLVGKSLGNIDNSYAIGSITGSQELGGIVGEASLNKIMNCYASVSIHTSNTYKISGIGQVNDIDSCYFDGPVSKVEDQYQYDKCRLTEELTQKETFSNWDFANIWDIEEGSSYPYLRSCSKPNEVYENLEMNFAGGNGTEANPYIITTSKHLDNLRYKLDGFYIINEDIDLNGVSWSPIGVAYQYGFSGLLDGNGHIIKNLNINNANSDYIGLFKMVKGGEIKNLTLDNVYLRGRDKVGGLVAEFSTGTILNCHIKGQGSINGEDYVGGLVGSHNGSEGVIKGCSSKLNVTGVNNVGGLIGLQSGGEVKQCYSLSDVSGKSGIGGLIGSTEAYISECYHIGDVEADNKGVGGLIAYSTNNIENCFAIGATTTSTSYAGGLVYSVGNGSIVNSFAACSLRLTGDNRYYDYSSIGGLYGSFNFSNYNETVTDSYYNGVIAGIEQLSDDNVSRVTEKMLSQNDYKGWDFKKIWSIDEGETYPYLTNLPKPEYDSTYLEKGFNGGKGTIEAPFTITNKEQLNNIRYQLDANYEIINDINLSGSSWEPIGNIAYPFTGSINGNNHVLSNLYINNPTNYRHGLFDTLKSARLENLVLDSVRIYKGASIMYGGGTGALAVTQVDGEIINCHVIGNSSIAGQDQTGGLVGLQETQYCFISKCSVEAYVQGKNLVGGIIGSQKGDISLSYHKNRVYGERNVGGISGSSIGNIINCYNLDEVNGIDRIGGIVGSIDSSNIIKNCYVAGEIDYSRNRYCRYGGITSSYTANTQNSYFDLNVSRITKVDSANIGRSTTEMKKQETYNEWDFNNIWTIDENSTYPYFDIKQSVETETPSNITFILDQDILTINWEPIEGTLLYEVYFNGDIIRVNNNQLIKEGLKPGIYNIKVRASKQGVLSDWSNEINVTVKDNTLGSSDNPYKIYTVEDLINIKNDLEGYYILMNDIDLNGVKWVPIGDINNKFFGSLDGQDNTIMNLSINNDMFCGLFSELEGGEVSNLIIQNVYINGNQSVGALAGRGKNITINNVHIKGTGSINGHGTVGGLIGQVTGSKNLLKNCSNSINVNSNYSSGGLVSSFSEGTIMNCHTNCNVLASENKTSFSNGGLIGSANNAVIELCSSRGYIKGKDYVGGIVGQGTNTKIKQCYSITDIHGERYVAGIAAKLSGEITNCFTMSSVYSDEISCGIAYTDVNSSIINCYSVSKFNNNNFSALGHAAIKENSYYDGITLQKVCDTEAYYSRLTSDLKRKETFINWDFDTIWAIEENSSYPYLRGMDIPDEIYNINNNDMAGGSGTLNDPYLITTKEQLNNIRYNSSAHYKLANDIDLLNSHWEPICIQNNIFRGSLDGNSHIISNLSIIRSSDNDLALFSQVSGEIKNLTIQNVNVHGHDQVGALVANLTNGNIYNCHVEGQGEVSAKKHVGGLVGHQNGQNSLITNCSSNINVIGEDNVGGLVGYQQAGVIELCAVKGKTTGKNENTGGMIGYSTGSLKRSFTDGEVLGNSYVGGLSGYSQGCIENCYSISNVQGDTRVGGLVGYITKGTLTNSYASNKVSAGNNSYIGGVMGYSLIPYDVSSTYYDGITSQIVTSDQYNKSLLPTQMKYKYTYEGWDFDTIWQIDEGTSYPYLRQMDNPSDVKENLPKDDIAGGKGTIDEPFKISNRTHLESIRYNLDAHYILLEDIDLSSQVWEPIATEKYGFNGSLDGDDYIIYNVTSENGLFLNLNNAYIKNLIIQNANVGNNQVQYVGALASKVTNSNIVNCQLSGKSIIVGQCYVGGLLGQMIGGVISDCDVYGEVKGIGSNNSIIGGMIGYSENITMNQCKSEANMSGHLNIGGIIGTQNGGTINDCYSLATIEAYENIGGIVGSLINSGKITNSYAVCQLGGSININGLAGINNGTITNSYFDSEIVGISTPSTQARNTEQLKQLSTFQQWDYDTIWKIKEGETYPYFRKLDVPQVEVKDKSHESILLNWLAIEDSTGYEIEIDRTNIIEIDNITEFLHNSLSNDKLYRYRVRAINDNVKSRWSRAFEEVPHLLTPDNLTIDTQEGIMKIMWGDVPKADKYLVYINNDVTEVGSNEFIYSEVKPCQQYLIKVKAINDITDSKYMNTEDFIYLVEGAQQIYGTISTIEETGDKEIRLVGKNIEDLYTIQIKANFNNEQLKLKPEELKNLLDIEGVYYETQVNEDAVILIISKTGIKNGFEGSFDICKFNFSSQVEDLSNINLDIKAVDSRGEYLDAYTADKLYVY